MRVCGGRAVWQWGASGLAVGACGINVRRWKQAPFGGNEKAPRGAGPFTVLQVCASYFLAVFLAGAGLAASCAFWAASSSDSCLPS